MQQAIIEYIQNRILKKNKKQQINIINKKNTLVYPNLRGFQLGFLIFFCFTCSIFYQINFAILLTIIIFFIFFLSIIVSFQNLNQLELNFKGQLIEAEKKTYVKIDLLNHSKNNKININLKNDYLSEVNIDVIKNFKIIDLPIFFENRGKFLLPTINVYSVFPFGIVKSSSYWKANNEIYVYPKPIKPNYEILSSHNLTQNHSDDYEFDSIDEYKIGENKSRIAWKNSIIRNKLLSKKFTSENIANNVLINLDNIKTSSFEKKLSYASYLILELYKKKIPFSLEHKKFSQKFANDQDHKNEALKYLSNVQN